MFSVHIEKQDEHEHRNESQTSAAFGKVTVRAPYFFGQTKPSWWPTC
jgi:hypothetical protein